MQSKKSKAQIAVLGGGALLAVVLQGLVSFVLSTQKEDRVPREEVVVAQAENPFALLDLQAHAVYVAEVKTGKVLFAKNEHEKLPLASVTKVMTALVAREAMSKDTVLTLTSDDLKAEGDSGLRTGERWRLGDLLDTTLLISSNDGAHAIARFVGSDGQGAGDANIARENFVRLMNEKAQALGLTQTEFFNESGLDVEEGKTVLHAGAYGSAHDVAVLFNELWKRYPDAIEITARKDARIFSQDNIAHILPNTNEITGRIPGLIASKTGFTDLAGGNLAIIFDRGVGDSIVMVVLGSTYKGRFEDVEKLAGVVRGNLTQQEK